MLGALSYSITEIIDQPAPFYRREHAALHSLMLIEPAQDWMFSLEAGARYRSRAL